MSDTRARPVRPLRPYDGHEPYGVHGAYDGRGASGRWPWSRVRRPGRGRVVLIVSAVVALAVVLVWLIAFSPVLGVRTVDVTGARSVTPAQVRAAARISTGTPLTRLDTGAVARRVEQIPRVASARVTTSLPSTVTIRVTERTAVAYIDAGGGYTLVDATGARFAGVGKQPSDLPRLEPGSTTTSVAGLARVAGALPASLRPLVTSVQSGRCGSIDVAVHDHGDDTTVRWGSADDNAAKARLVPTLLRDHPSIVDVSNPEQPYTH